MKFKISIAAAVILAALGGYLAASQQSRPADQDLMRDFIAAPSTSSLPARSQSKDSVAPVGDMLVGLKQRLERQPDDVQGWVLLSKSYHHLERQAEAEESFDKAVALGYAGDWKPLPRIDVFSKSDGSAQGFNSSIDLDNYSIGGSDLVGSSASPGLKLKVSIDPELEPRLAPESPVYIFVRAIENPGPPLAVVRKKVAELPLEIALNDSHAMMPDLKLSDAETVIVGARVSTSGNAARQPGDFEQLSNSIPSNFGETVELVISNQI